MNNSDSPRVYIIILNWNGWKDTIECLESVFRNKYPNFRVIVCDNYSTDGSLEYIQSWAEGRLDIPKQERNPLAYLSFPPVSKPIPYATYNKLDAENCVPDEKDYPLVLIQTGANLGFAGGNNVGLRYSLSRKDLSFAWLLNNDTVVKQDALYHLVRRMGEKPSAGMCGSKLLFYHEPDLVQGLGGSTYNRWFGTNRHLGLFQKSSQPVCQVSVEQEMRYVIGASMLVSKQFLEEIGLMSEEYFLYFEELDWITRGREKFSIAFAADSLVYHKEGCSAGTKSEQKRKSFLSDYYSIRNRLVFTKKFYPWALPSVYAGIGLAILNRVRRGQPDHARMISRILLTGGKSAPPSSIRASRS